MPGAEGDGATALIKQLELAPHPEGGWYRETWRSGEARAGRAIGTAILFLLEAGQRSHWHRVDADEVWLWHAGAPITLSMAASEKEKPADFGLGLDLASGYLPQRLVPAGHWQTAAPQGGWSLVSCLVVPGFDFSGFELAAPDWAPGT